MNCWNFLDDGLSVPPTSRNLRSRLLCWLGRRFALRHRNVHIPPSCRIHPGAKIHPRSGRIVLGENCTIAEGAILQGNIVMGDNCSVQSYSILVGYGKVGETDGQITIGNCVRIASHGMIVAANHRFDNQEKTIHGQGLHRKPIFIEENVWVGGRVNITAGTTIGQGSIIAAGAVVTKDVPAKSIAMGIPAQAHPIPSSEENFISKS